MNAYPRITQQIIQLLKEGTVPCCSWAPNHPSNLISKRRYRGINL